MHFLVMINKCIIKSCCYHSTSITSFSALIHNKLGYHCNLEHIYIELIFTYIPFTIEYMFICPSAIWMFVAIFLCLVSLPTIYAVYKLRVVEARLYWCGHYNHTHLTTPTCYNKVFFFYKPKSLIQCSAYPFKCHCGHTKMFV